MWGEGKEDDGNDDSEDYNDNDYDGNILCIMSIKACDSYYGSYIWINFYYLTNCDSCQLCF